MFDERLEQDEYGEVINSEKTFEGLAEILQKHTATIIGWTDLHGTHFDILLVVQPIQVGTLQRGLKARTDLFVSISGFGMFGFDIEREDTHSSYVGEKLQLGGGVTTEEVTNLINGVRRNLQ